MKPIFLSLNDNLYLDKVTNLDKFDKIYLKVKNSFEYYQYKGSTIDINPSMDIRTNMVFGFSTDESESRSKIHIPQYKKVFTVSIKKARSILRLSKKYTTQYFEEV